MTHTGAQLDCQAGDRREQRNLNGSTEQAAFKPGLRVTLAINNQEFRAGLSPQDSCSVMQQSDGGGRDTPSVLLAVELENSPPKFKKKKFALLLALY